MEAVKRESSTVASKKRDRWDEKQTGGNLLTAGDVYLEILEVFWEISGTVPAAVVTSSHFGMILREYER